jgi:hypothetical protein
LFLHYLQRWAKDYLRRRLDWVVDDMYGRNEYASNTNPRHMTSSLCPCQVKIIVVVVIVCIKQQSKTHDLLTLSMSGKNVNRIVRMIVVVVIVRVKHQSKIHDLLTLSVSGKNSGIANFDEYR